MHTVVYRRFLSNSCYLMGFLCVVGNSGIGAKGDVIVGGNESQKKKSRQSHDIPFLRDSGVHANVFLCAPNLCALGGVSFMYHFGIRVLSGLLACLMGLAVSANAGIDLGSGASEIQAHSGSFTHNIPIAAPPGVAGMQPALQLNYSSSQGNSMYGYGWGLNVARIERSLKRGKPLYTDADVFVLWMNGGAMELVAVGNGQYRAKRENAFLHITKIGNRWEVLDKAGTTYHFGWDDDVASPQKARWPQGVTQPFSWHLSKVVDTHANFMRYYYLDDVDGHRLEKVNYAPNNTLVLAYETRPANDRRWRYNTGYKKTIGARLISAKSYTNSVLAYDLTFEYKTLDARDHRSLLWQVTKNPVATVGVSVPAAITTQFNYTGSPVGSAGAPGIPKFDINGDTSEDVIDTFYLTAFDRKVYGIFTQFPAYSFPMGQASIGAVDPAGSYGLVDLNADGLLDKVMINAHVVTNIDDRYFPHKTVFDGAFRVYYNTGSGYSNTAEVWVDPLKFGFSGNTRSYGDMVNSWGFADVNGDGLKDRVGLFTRSVGGNFAAGSAVSGVFLNTGKGSFETVSSAATYPFFGLGAIRNHNVRGNISRSVWANTPLISSVTELSSGLQKNITYTLQTVNMSNGKKMSVWTATNISTSGPGVETRSASNAYSGGFFDDVAKEFRGFSMVVQTDSQSGLAIETAYHQDAARAGLPIYVESHTANRTVISRTHNTFEVKSLGQGRTWGRLAASTVKQYEVKMGYKSLPRETVYIWTNLVGTPASLIASALYQSKKADYHPLNAITLDGSPIDSRTPYGRARSYFLGLKNKRIDRDGPRQNWGGYWIGIPDPAWIPDTPLLVTNMAMTYDDHGNILTSSKSTSDGFSKATVNTYENNAVCATVPEARTRMVEVTTTVMVPEIRTGMVYTYVRRKISREWTWIWEWVPYTYTVMVPQTSIQMVPETYYVQVPDPYCRNRFKLTRAEVTSTSPADALGVTRISAFQYDATGYMIKEIIEPDNAVLRLDTDYTYDTFGNRLTTTVSGSGITPRTTAVTYDINGLFPISTTNALGHTESYTWDARFGVKTALTGPNGLTTRWQHDDFGRKVAELRADATRSDITYHLNAAPLYVTKTSTGSPASTIYYDVKGRETRSEGVLFDGTPVYVDTQYDSLGRVSRKSLPHKGLALGWTTNGYDEIGRIISVTAPTGDIATTTYDGLTTTGTNALGQKTTTVKNSQDNVVSVTDHLGGVMRYGYDVLGNLTDTTDAAGHVTTMSYDIRGRKTGMNDPDMGIWSYQYDVLGNLISQTDAKNQSTVMSYDELGRMVSRTEPEGLSTWTYDTLWVGALTSESGPVSSKTYSYDILGRVTTSTTMVNGQTFAVDTTYDAIGRVDTVIYPQGSTASRFAVKRNYNAQGFMASISNVATGVNIWQANTVDEFGHTTSERFGNGVVTNRVYDNLRGVMTGMQSNSGTTAVQDWAYDHDAGGNMLFRNNRMMRYIESFSYDGLNRLTSVYRIATMTTRVYTGGRKGFSKRASPSKTYAYDAIGNITSKSDVGAYTYDLNHPHAVATAGGNSYAYDANGNMLSGAGRTLSWTSFNKPLGVSTVQGYTGYTYDANHNRLIKTTPNSTTVYIGKLFEQVTMGVVSKDVNYVYAGSTLVASIEDVAGIVSEKYMHADHLGSINVITDSTGVVLERLSFDAFGKPRNVNGTNSVNSVVVIHTTRGYTGHEMDAESGLINMNARLYDPVLGRFISADTVIPSPGNMQGFNRYAYVNNNPLMYVDPSGHFVIALAAALMTAAAASAITTLSSFIFAVVYAAIASYAVSLGSAKAALIGAASVGLSYGIGEYVSGIGQGVAEGAQAISEYQTTVTLHVVKGGVLSVAGGGNFLSGALSAGITSGLGGFIGTFDSDFSQYVAAGLIGGVASIVGGGKFLDGFSTGAFTYAFNHKVHNPTGKGIRGSDKHGDGAFGASRKRHGVSVKGGHVGADFVSEAGQDVVAPIGGKVDRIVSGKYAGLVVGNGEGDSWKILYVDVADEIKVGSNIRAGQSIGKAQNIQLRYGEGITNHIHLKLKINSNLVDPADYINVK